MFNNDITKNYNFQDATSEILIMLVGSFLLGFLISWLLQKLLNKDNIQNNQTSILHSDVNKQSLSESKSAETVRVVKQTPRKPYLASRTDDLTKIQSITPEIQSMLKEVGINSYTDLRDIERHELKSIQENVTTQAINRKEMETWPHQANLAAKGDWTKLKEYQAFIARSQKAAQNIKNQPKTKPIDDLKVIEGIGPKIEEILHSKGIASFKELSNTDTVTLKKYIVDEDSRFNKNETESWPHQAAMAEKGQWEELSIYQEFMHSETTIDSTSEKNNFTRMNSKIDDQVTQSSNDESDLNDYDDLKKIEGIGPKIEELLNKSGIYTFSQLQNSTHHRLKDILTGAGNQYKMHNSETWPEQAGMAHHKKWKALEKFQKTIRINKSKKTIEEQQLRTSINSDIKNTKDDLTTIEGIGPNIQKLLGKSGIHTFDDLSKHKKDYLKSLLDKGGAQYRVHNPESWPEQAAMAHKKEWEELERLQKTIRINSAEKSNKESSPNTQINSEFKTIKTTKDDLKKIEGIGPKIQELLGKSGIHTFADLSKHKRDYLKHLLDEGGPQYRVHEPESWPQQAQLAKDGQWDALKKLQNDLIEGRE